MKPNSYYLQLFLGFCVCTLLYSMFSDFYPVVKSMFFKDTDTSLLFQKTFAQMGWIRIIIKPLFIGAFVAYVSYRERQNFLESKLK